MEELNQGNMNAEQDMNPGEITNSEMNQENTDSEENVIEIPAEAIRAEIKRAKKRGTLKGCLITIAVVITIFVTVIAAYVFACVRRGTVPFGIMSYASSGVIDKDVVKKAEGIYAMLENGYLYDIDKDAVKEGVYKGIVNELGDPYSVYYTKEEFDAMMESSSGSFEGIGCYMTQDPDTMEVYVSHPMRNSPAEAAGLKVNDIIVTVDDEDISGQDINLVVSKIRGPKGTNVKLGIKRSGKDDIIEFTIERAVVYEESVEGGMLSDLLEDSDIYKNIDVDGVGYISIIEFADDTANQFRDELNALKDAGATSLIIDLRDNGGGYVDVCVEIADMILPECNIVSTKDKHGITTKSDSSDEEYIRMPIVVLANGNTASASEILIGALRDNDYATVIGEKTFGKGIVQEVLPLDDGSGIKFTICEYYTPSGKCIHDVGFEPDVKVEFDYDRYLEDGYDNQFVKACEYLKK